MALGREMVGRLGRLGRRLWDHHIGVVVALCGAVLLEGVVSGGLWSNGVLLSVPWVLAGLVLDAHRWRMHQNRDRQRIFQYLNSTMLEDKVKLLERLLALRQSLREQEVPSSGEVERLELLIIDQHRQCANLHKRTEDSALMIPLLTAAYSKDMAEITWTASLTDEFEAHRQGR